MPDNNTTEGRKHDKKPSRLGLGISGFLAALAAFVAQSLLMDHPMALRVLVSVLTVLVVLGIAFGISRVMTKRHP